MNAAFLLVTSAWMAGQTVAPVSHQSAAPVVVSNGHGSCNGCGSSSISSGCCDSGFSYAAGGCCESGHGSGGGMLGKLRGMFKRGGHGSDCCEAVCETSCAPVSTGCCDSGRGNGGMMGKLRGFFKKHHGGDCCEAASSCCDGGCGTAGYPTSGIISNGHGTGSCAPSPALYGNGGSHAAPSVIHGAPSTGTVIHGAPSTGTVIQGAPSTGSVIQGSPLPQAPINGKGGERIVSPPNRMPADRAPAREGNPAPRKQDNPPRTESSAAPTAPSIEVVPPAAPSLDADRRDPF